MLAQLKRESGERVIVVLEDAEQLLKSDRELTIPSIPCRACPQKGRHGSTKSQRISVDTCQNAQQGAPICPHAGRSHRNCESASHANWKKRSPSQLGKAISATCLATKIVHDCNEETSHFAVPLPAEGARGWGLVYFPARHFDRIFTYTHTHRVQYWT